MYKQTSNTQLYREYTLYSANTIDDDRKVAPTTQKCLHKQLGCRMKR